MREILFKAKRIDNGEWAEGYVFDDGFVDGKRMFVGGIVITDYHGTADDVFEVTETCFYEVNPDTICQYTGLTDKNGNKIWENDVVENVVQISYLGDRFRVYWNDKYACYDIINAENHSSNIPLSENKSYKVIGNIFDNPELLEEGAK